jgi:hypothetical protein
MTKIVVTFNPPLEKKDWESVLPKVQQMFPDWTWCGSTGTPTVRKREDILTGALNNIYMKEIGSLIYDRHYQQEAGCLMYSGSWTQLDTDSYVKMGQRVEVIDGWQIDSEAASLDAFGSLDEINLKKIIKDTINESEDYDWIDISDVKDVVVVNPGSRFPTYIEAMEGLGVTGVKEFINKFSLSWWTSSEFEDYRLNYGYDGDEGFLQKYIPKLIIPEKNDICVVDMSKRIIHGTKKIYKLVRTSDGGEFIMGEEGFIEI